ncbi:MAG: hypothetical protein HW416_2311 [Chloroflexi bacterium]|nr:hypothetical protein [Chloroflexota bacterium]
MKQLADSGFQARPPAHGPWVMAQTWEHLLFAHWPVAVEELSKIVPGQLEVDMIDGSGWIGVVPFGISALHVRGFPPIPGLAAFPEINVRTYVTVGGEPGVYFFSLDAANALAVAAARLTYLLPYYHARMSQRFVDGSVTYSSDRRPPVREPVVFEARYWPTGPVFNAEPGSLEFGLTERYCLYSVDRAGRVYRARIDHDPWPLQVAAARFGSNSMAQPTGVKLPNQEPLLHYAERQNVRVWPIRRVRGERQ